MLYHINAAEVKSPEWRILSLTGLDGVNYEDVSVNFKDREGKQQWESMEAFEEGKSINGNVWKSPTNKFFLFPLREKAKTGGAPGIKAAQERKSEMIEKAQENKGQAIKVAAAMRDCTLITLASLKDQPFPTMDDFDREFTSYLEWYMRKYERAEKMADTPFR